MLERIFLDKPLRKNDEFSYEQVNVWLNKLLDRDFEGRNIIVKQLNGAKYEIERDGCSIFIKFIPNNDKKYPRNEKTPITMLVKQRNTCPVDILLFTENGFVKEMEIYTVDGSYNDGKFSVDDVEYLIY